MSGRTRRARDRAIQLLSLAVVITMLSGCALDHRTGEIFVVWPASQSDLEDEAAANNEVPAQPTGISQAQQPSSGKDGARGVKQ